MHCPWGGGLKNAQITISDVFSFFLQAKNESGKGVSFCSEMRLFLTPNKKPPWNFFYLRLVLCLFDRCRSGGFLLN